MVIVDDTGAQGSDELCGPREPCLEDLRNSFTYEPEGGQKIIEETDRLEEIDPEMLKGHPT